MSGFLLVGAGGSTHTTNYTALASIRDSTGGSTLYIYYYRVEEDLEEVLLESVKPYCYAPEDAPEERFKEPPEFSYIAERLKPGVFRAVIDHRLPAFMRCITMRGL